MTAGRVDLSCTKGSAFAAYVVVKNPDLELASLQYWDARMQVRRTYESTSSLVEFTSANGRLTKDTETAKITLSLSAEETGGLEIGEHVYDLEVFSTGSQPAVLKLMKGIFSVE
jgi:hypothetical protein